MTPGTGEPTAPAGPFRPEPFVCPKCGCRAYIAGHVNQCRVCRATFDPCIGPDTPANQAHRRAVLLALDEKNWCMAPIPFSFRGNQYTRRIA